MKFNGIIIALVFLSNIVASDKFTSDSCTTIWTTMNPMKVGADKASCENFFNKAVSREKRYENMGPAICECNDKKYDGDDDDGRKNWVKKQEGFRVKVTTLLNMCKPNPKPIQMLCDAVKLVEITDTDVGKPKGDASEKTGDEVGEVPVETKLQSGDQSIDTLKEAIYENKVVADEPKVKESVETQVEAINVDVGKRKVDQSVQTEKISIDAVTYWNNVNEPKEEKSEVLKLVEVEKSEKTRDNVVIVPVETNETAVQTEPEQDLDEKDKPFSRFDDDDRRMVDSSEELENFKYANKVRKHKY